MLLLLAFQHGWTKPSAKVQTVYKYRKYQKFDFDDLVIDGGTGLPDSLSVERSYRRKYKNKLPYRKNFNPEIRRGAERIR